MANLEVNIEGSEEIMVPETDVLEDDSYDQNTDEDIDEIDYDESVDIADLETELELDDFNDEH